jgi:hypothetical protein
MRAASFQFQIKIFCFGGCGESAAEAMRIKNSAPGQTVTGSPFLWQTAAGCQAGKKTKSGLDRVLPGLLSER